jgi:tetrapyrrole methylase family protein/MazG family protein
MDKLNDVTEKLLSKDGCPWDKAQTHQSLKQYLIEECYETADAIDNEDYENMCEELGDVLFQITMHSKIAEREHKFTFDDVCEGVTKKMINRHPHVFGDGKNKAYQKWEDIKKQEKNYLSVSDAMRRIAKSLPSLMRAEKIQKKAENAEYDFGNEFENARKLLDELENREDMTKGQRSEKIGEILFKLSNISRKFEINSEFALTNYSEKFINRFEDIESGH